MEKTGLSCCDGPGGGVGVVVPGEGEGVGDVVVEVGVKRLVDSLLEVFVERHTFELQNTREVLEVRISPGDDCFRRAQPGS